MPAIMTPATLPTRPRRLVVSEIKDFLFLLFCETGIARLFHLVENALYLFLTRLPL